MIHTTTTVTIENLFDLSDVSGDVLHSYGILDGKPMTLTLNTSPCGDDSRIGS